MSLGRETVVPPGGEHVGASGERVTFDVFSWVVVLGVLHFVVIH